MTKQLFTSLLLCTIFNNNFYAMNKNNDNDDEKFCFMTCHRPSGYWQMGSLLPSNLRSSEETSKENQREPWHIYSHYVAEPFCTVSNIPFFLAAYAIRNAHPLSATALTLAGSASAISHAIPYQFLNDIDKMGAALAFATVTYDAHLYNPAELTSILHNQKKLLAVAAVTAIKFADFWAARSKQIVKNSNGVLSEKLIVKRKPEHTLIHVAWHILAAWAAYVLLIS